MAKKAFVYDGTQWVDIAQSTTDLSNYPNMTTTPISGFRNFLINGDFRINQRNGTTQVVDPVSASKYVTDRWACYRSSFATGARYQTVSVDTSLLPNVSLEAARVGRINTTTGTGVIALRQPIEIDNIGHTVGQVMTLSFYARAGAGFSSASSILVSEIYEDTVQVSPGSGTTSPKNTFQSNILTTSWQRFTHTFTRDAAKPYVNGISFNYTPVGTATSTDHFEITGVQLELGDTATPFENRPIGTELALCQRYYIRYSNGAALQPLGTCSYYTTTSAGTHVIFPVEMREKPVGGESAASAIIVYSAGTSRTSTGIADSQMSTKASEINITTSAATAGNAGVSFVTANNWIDFSAEL
jgi:hypothetical protein